MDPRSLTKEQALEYIKKAEPKDLETILRLVGLVDGEGHWLAGDGWVGPKPDLAQPGASWLVDRIRSGFASQDVATEITDRKTGGIAGQAPSWSLTVSRSTADESITEEETSLISEAEAPLTWWWDDRDIHGWLILGTFTYIATGKASFRLFIPPDLLQNTADGKGKLPPSAPTLQEALSYVYVDHPKPSQSTVHVNRRRMAPVGIYSEKQDDDSDIVEIVFAEGKNTVFRYISQSGTNEYTLPLNGRLTIHEMSGRALITQHIITLQKALNFARSMITRTLETQGFLRQIITNAQMPKEVVIENGVPKEVEAPLELGPEMSAFINGHPVESDDGDGGKKVTMTTPGVHWAQPVDSKPVTEVGDAIRHAMLVMAQQGHAIGDDKAAESGESKRQGRADYSSSLKRSTPAVEKAGRWLLEGALGLAEVIMGKPGYYTSRLRAVFECNRDEGPVSVAESEFLSGAVEDGTLPHEYVLEQMGVQDVDAVMVQIRKSPGYFNQVFEMIEKAYAAGIPRATAVELARLKGMIDDDTAALLQPKVEEDVEQ